MGLVDGDRNVQSHQEAERECCELNTEDTAKID